MISFTCPVCSKAFDVEASRAGAYINCAQCGKQLFIPQPGTSPITTPSVFNQPSAAPDPAPAESTPTVQIADEPPVVAPPLLPPESHPASTIAADNPYAQGLLVRFFYGDHGRKIPTSLSLEEARKVIRRVIYDFNLDVEGNRDVYGEIQHSYSAFLKTKVDGEIIYRQKKNELIVDLACRNNVTGVAILLGILCWPLLIVGAIVLPNQGKQEFERAMRDACRELERRLCPNR